LGKTLGAKGTLVLGNVQTAPGAVPKGPTTAFVGRMADIRVSVRRTVLTALDTQVRPCRGSRPSGPRARVRAGCGVGR
jgi:hypothetical protein